MQRPAPTPDIQESDGTTADRPIVREVIASGRHAVEALRLKWVISAAEDDHVVPEDEDTAELSPDELSAVMDGMSSVPRKA